MDLMHLVDRLEELVAGAQKMPIGNRAILDRRRLLDIIDQMRIAIPEEVREAQEMVLRREEIRREAEEEARIIVARAEERAARLVEAHEVVEAARRRAQEVSAQAEARLEERIRQANEDIQGRLDQSRQLARAQMEAADEYARELLSRLRRQLEAFVRSVDSGIRQLEPERHEGPESGIEPLPAVASAGLALEDEDEDFDDAADDQPEAADAGQDTAEREPVPLRRGRVERVRDDELENLLRRSPAVRGERGERGANVIDDFANPPLDDDPTQREDED
ncbi:MAG: hypothetical protein FJZ92_09520 [Chloroflexi bacterium]|nr:hypothetical protein [Chloroflexota bacterium]